MNPSSRTFNSLANWVNSASSLTASANRYKQVVEGSVTPSTIPTDVITNAMANLPGSFR